jgi:hypothetical protein
MQSFRKAESHGSGFDIFTKWQGIFGFRPGVNGAVPVSTYPRRR